MRRYTLELCHDLPLLVELISCLLVPVDCFSSLAVAGTYRKGFSFSAFDWAFPAATASPVLQPPLISSTDQLSLN